MGEEARRMCPAVERPLTTGAQHHGDDTGAQVFPTRVLTGVHHGPRMAFRWERPGTDVAFQRICGYAPAEQTSFPSGRGQVLSYGKGLLLVQVQLRAGTGAEFQAGYSLWRLCCLYRETQGTSGRFHAESCGTACSGRIRPEYFYLICFHGWQRERG